MARAQATKLVEWQYSKNFRTDPEDQQSANGKTLNQIEGGKLAP